MNYYEGCTLKEIMAFRNLESEIFDFGQGPMKMEGLLGSEDAYYEMAIQDILDSEVNDELDNLDDVDNSFIIPKNNHYHHKTKDKLKMKRLYEVANWWTIGKRDDYYVRKYKRPRVARIYKRLSNKKVRQNKNIPSGGSYKKVYDYLCNVI